MICESKRLSLMKTNLQIDLLLAAAKLFVADFIKMRFESRTS